MIINETLRTLKQRRSIRSFRDEQIKEEELQAVLEAGLYAPNAGDQAWHFTVIQNKELLDRLNLAAKEGAKQLDIEGLEEMANNEQYNCLYGAPTLIIVSGKQAPIPLEADCAAATQNLLLAAESIGLGSCWIYFVIFAFYSPLGPELSKELKIPEGYKPYYSAVLGYKQDSVVNVPVRKPNLITYIR
ncbi:nitroreductase family protein [Desulfosporosinus sp. BICA1-9]|uniref:nitroreductase family protein n=1 Tax=Desulfosporosinus sp. BICA1-9 TaxID=1531958 RepID=UPI00061E2A5E|nr:nitroreductase family protein [Desulfosporosinus sp. BICA1-9]KJS49044.1 MAG: nitroreductase [Peptococcaceae bacterium BRH_c23]HBW35997.1 nitroreductase [Desulfosporosinus sp.]